MNANPYAYLDDAPLEERRARAVEMRRMLPESVLSEVGRLDPAAIAEVREEAWPDVRDADELHDALQTLVALPEAGSIAPSVAWSLESRWRTGKSISLNWRRDDRAARAMADGRTLLGSHGKSESVRCDLSRRAI